MKKYLKSCLNISNILMIMGTGCTVVAIGKRMISYGLQELKDEWNRI